MSSDLQGNEVVVIGGSSGLGLATAAMAQAAGAHVTIVGRDPDRLAAALEQLGPAARGARFDVAEEVAVHELFASFDHVDHVAVFAGSRVDGEIASLDTATIHGPVNDRVWGALFVCRHAAPVMTDGSITICSGVGVGRPRRGAAVVAAAAGGAEIVARVAAQEVAPVRVNVIRPGVIDTPLLSRVAGDRHRDMMAAQAKRIPLGRIGRPEDIAHAVGFLMTNTYVTGTTLTVDGGISLV